MNLWKLSTILLLTTLACVVSRGAVNSAHAQPEPQPQMIAALTHLERAKGALEASTLDKGGHRLRAIELTEEAMGQIRHVLEDEKGH